MKSDLLELQKKIRATWALLDIDGHMGELQKLEKDMQAEGFWNDTENATDISKRHEEFRSEIDTWKGIQEKWMGSSNW